MVLALTLPAPVRLRPLVPVKVSVPVAEMVAALTTAGAVKEMFPPVSAVPQQVVTMLPLADRLKETPPDRGLAELDSVTVSALVSLKFTLPVPAEAYKLSPDVLPLLTSKAAPVAVPLAVILPPNAVSDTPGAT